MLKTEKYEITRENLLMHELIGLNARIEQSFDENKKGIKGRIVDETKNVFELETESGVKVIPKKEVELVFELGNENVRVKGEQLVARPEDRVKLCWRKKNAGM